MKKCGEAIVLILAVIGLAVCSPPERVVVAPVEEIDWEAMIQEADNLAARGHYTALVKAWGIYQEIMDEPSERNAVLEKAARTLVALNLREKDLGILNEETLSDLEGLVSSESSLSAYAPFAELLGYLPVLVKGTAGDGLPKGRILEEQIEWIADRALPLDEALEREAGSSDAAACLRLVFRNRFFFKFRVRLEPGPYVALYPRSRLVAFQSALTPERNRERLSSLLDEDPEFHEIHYFLGDMTLEEGKLLTAEKHYHAALEGIPGFPSALISLAKIAFQMEELESCLEYNEKALALIPAYRDALLGKGLCLGYLGRNEEAIEVLRRILELGFHYVGEAHYWTAWNLNELGRLDQAEKSIESAKTFLIGQSDVFTLSGIIAYGQGRLAEAEKDLRVALDIQPADCDAAYYLGKIYADRKEWLSSGIYFMGAANCFEAKEQGLEKRIREIEESELSLERKQKLVVKKRLQIVTTQTTKATCQYNGAAGFHNGGKFAQALELAEKARAHPSFTDLAADLIKMIKDRSGTSLPRTPN